MIPFERQSGKACGWVADEYETNRNSCSIIHGRLEDSYRSFDDMGRQTRQCPIRSLLLKTAESKVHFQLESDMLRVCECMPKTRVVEDARCQTATRVGTTTVGGSSFHVPSAFIYTSVGNL